MLSTHKCEVVPIKLEVHPNADSLSICRVFDEYQVVLRTSDWLDRKLGVYFPPDSIVDVARPEFAFLKTKEGQITAVVRAIKLRGLMSFGLMVPAPDFAKEGDDLAEYYGVKRYEELPPDEPSEKVSLPPFLAYLQKYDVDTFKKYGRIFEGEQVLAHEKINGQNARYTWSDQQYCSSHYNWKAESQKDPWWQVFYQSEFLQKFCRDNPKVILCGENYGKVKGFRYGVESGEKFIAFDIIRDKKFVDYNEFTDLCDKYSVPRVPQLYQGIFQKETLLELAEKPSTLAKNNGVIQISEGLVIRTPTERWNDRCGRMVLKMVSEIYLSSKR